MFYNNEILEKKYIIKNPKKIENYIDHVIKEKDLTFELIENYSQLVIPSYYSYLLEDISIAEIYFFNNFLIDHYPYNIENKGFIDKIKLIKDKNLPKEIVIKYWLKAYTYEGDFYKELNKDLRISKKNIWIYFPFIKLCYEGIRKKFLTSSKKKLYRGSKISVLEYAKLQTLFFKKINDFPKILLYSKSFLSFSDDYKQAKKFLDPQNQSTSCIQVLYIIEEIKNDNYDKITLSNARIEEYSNYREKEVLIFPLSCFELINIELNDRTCVTIHLRYIGIYKNLIKEKLGENYMEKIKPTNFSQDLLVNGIVKNNYIPSWVLKEKIDFQINKIYFFMKNNEYLVTSIKNLILIFSINEFGKGKGKIKINVHNDEVLNVIYLENNEICSTSKDRTIKIILITNQRKFGVLKIINLGENYAKNILLFNKNKLVFLMNNNHFEYYNFKVNKYLKRENYKRIWRNIKYTSTFK